MKSPLRMPTVVCYPSEVEGGKTIDDIILNIDFPALLLDYADAGPMQGMQGRSFRSNLNGKRPENWRQSMYYRYWTNQPERPAHLGIRTDQYKLAFFLWSISSIGDQRFNALSTWMGVFMI